MTWSSCWVSPFRYASIDLPIGVVLSYFDGQKDERGREMVRKGNVVAERP